MANTELQDLVRVLEERDIRMSHDDVAWAFEHETSAESIKQWMHDSLTPSTLLTKQELTFHNAAGKGVRRQPGQAFAGRPLGDAEFEAAIVSLEASTLAIEKQCQLLEAQRQALHELKIRNTADDRLSIRQDRRKNLSRDRAQLDFEVTEAADSLQSNLQASSKQAAAAAAALPSNIDRVLDKDDRLLDGLQKLLPKLANGDEASDTVAEVDRLCDALTMHSAQEIRSRVDSIYRSSVDSYLTHPDGHGEPDERQADSLRAELDELSHEIDSLTTMAVDNQHRLPISRELKGTESDAQSNRARWAEYVAATLQYLTARLMALQEHFQDLQAHQSALKQISATLDSALAQSAATGKTEAQASPRSPATPVSAKGLKPLRLVEANKLSEPQDPVVQLLREHDIRVADPNDTAKLHTTLARTVADRQARLSLLQQSTERTITDQQSESITKAERDVQDLLSAVYRYSPFGTVRVVDEGIQAGLSGLEATTQSIGQDMRELDVDGMTKQIREQQREILQGGK